MKEFYKYFFSVLLILAQLGWGQIPKALSYQGILTDMAGGAGPNGDYDLTFKIFDNPISGEPLWTETHYGVQLTRGLFNVILGSTTPLGPSLFSETPRYMGITVDGGAEIEPRMQCNMMV